MESYQNKSNKYTKNLEINENNHRIHYTDFLGRFEEISVLTFLCSLLPPSGEFYKLQQLVTPLPRLLLCSLTPAAQTEGKHYVQTIRCGCFSARLASDGQSLPERGK